MDSTVELTDEQIEELTKNIRKEMIEREQIKVDLIDDATLVAESKLKILEDDDSANKQKTISMLLIGETSIDTDVVESLSEDEKYEWLMNLSMIHLEWIGIRKIEKLEMFTQLQVLYLQHNNITKIENLNSLKQLQYLALDHNQIIKIENISSLDNLIFLKLNNNQIGSMSLSELPPLLVYLNLLANPIKENQYEKEVVQKFKSLEVLNDKTISSEYRFKMMGIFPNALEDYAQKLQDFKAKKAIKQKIKKNSEKEEQINNVSSHSVIATETNQSRQFDQDEHSTTQAHDNSTLDNSTIYSESTQEQKQQSKSVIEKPETQLVKSSLQKQEKLGNSYMEEPKNMANEYIIEQKRKINKKREDLLAIKKKFNKIETQEEAIEVMNHATKSIVFKQKEKTYQAMNESLKEMSDYAEMHVKRLEAIHSLDQNRQEGQLSNQMMIQNFIENRHQDIVNNKYELEKIKIQRSYFEHLPDQNADSSNQPEAIKENQNEEDDNEEDAEEEIPIKK